jgi:hypothetical protein
MTNCVLRVLRAVKMAPKLCYLKETTEACSNQFLSDKFEHKLFLLICAIHIFKPKCLSNNTIKSESAAK